MVIALDLGTSSARATLYDLHGRAVPGRFHQVTYAPTLTHDGGVEHDPTVLLEAVATCLDAITRASRHDDIRAVGVTTFWHGLLGFDAARRPITPIFTWADSRSAPDAALLRGALDDATLHERTGCHLHSSYWPAKLRWLARERPADVARVAFWGSIGEHLELALFGETATSVSMASGTGLFDQETLRWDTEALAAAGVESDRLFPLADAGGRRGLRAPWSGRWPALRSVPWFPAVGDGAASNVGSDCIDPSRIALNVGTSAAIRLVTADHGTAPPGLWRYRVDRRRALVGGATSEGGNVHAWCRDVLKLPPADEVERDLAERAPDSHGLTLLPFLAGERAPGWRGDRRATIARSLAQHDGGGHRPRGDGGRGAPAHAHLLEAGAPGRPGSPAGRVRRCRRPLASLDPHAGGRLGPTNPLVAGERSDQPRGRAARAGGPGGPARPRGSAGAAGRSLRTRPGASRALSRGVGTAATSG